MKLWKRKPKDKFPIQTDYPVELAFQVDGRPFYQFCTPDNIPAGRALSVLKMYTQLQTNCDEEWLKYYSEAMNAILTAQDKIDLPKLMELNKMLKDRLEWAFHPGLLFEFASVVYMGEDENPYTYDEEYNRQKIEWWKEHATLHDFLIEPFRKLIPFIDTADTSPVIFSQVIAKMDLQQHIKLSEILSLKTPSSGSVQKLQLRMRILEGLQNYAAGQRPSTFSTSRKDYGN